MKVAISGASGLIGTALSQRLTKSGIAVIPLVRDKNKAGENDLAVFWDPYNKIIEKEKLEGIDALVHLSGENLAERWNDEKKLKIRRSRIETTEFLSETLLSLDNPPKTFIQASAVGIYGSRGDEILTEDSSAGKGFLADVTSDWEKASEPLDNSPIRTVKIRISMVLAAEGGALAKMIPAFKTGVGGKIGDGKQYVSWITLEDLTALFEFAFTNDTLAGPANAAAPNPVTNEQFTKALGDALGRPTVAKVPAFAVKMMFGEMGKETVLASVRAVPKKVQETGFQFKYPEIEQALKAVIKK